MCSFTTGLTKFSLSELKDATHNFSNENKIGASEYGTVYRVRALLMLGMLFCSNKFHKATIQINYQVKQHRL